MDFVISGDDEDRLARLAGTASSRFGRQIDIVAVRLALAEGIASGVIECTDDGILVDDSAVVALVDILKVDGAEGG